jgi:hypothetical protein
VLARDEAASRINVDLPVLAKHETGHSFHGLLASQLQCKQCGFKVCLKIYYVPLCKILLAKLVVTGQFFKIWAMTSLTSCFCSVMG